MAALNFDDIEPIATFPLRRDDEVADVADVDADDVPPLLSRSITDQATHGLRRRMRHSEFQGEFLPSPPKLSRAYSVDTG